MRVPAQQPPNVVLARGALQADPAYVESRTNDGQTVPDEAETGPVGVRNASFLTDLDQAETQKSADLLIIRQHTNNLYVKTDTKIRDYR